MMFWDVEVRNRTPQENFGENVGFYNQLPWWTYSRGDGDSDVKRPQLTRWSCFTPFNPIDNEYTKTNRFEKRKRDPLTKMGDVHFDLTEWNGCYCKNFSKNKGRLGSDGSCERFSVVCLVFLDMYTSQQFLERKEWGWYDEDENKTNMKILWRTHV